MTVQAANVPVPNVDRDAAERLYTELYTEYWPRVTRFLWTRMHVHQMPLAEDLAQETFIRFWKDFVSTGRLEDVDNCFGLLATMAKHAMARYFERSHRPESAMDFADDANRWVFPVQHSYAPGSPHLAALSRELDAAMDRMTDASQLWRDKHNESYKLRIRLGDRYHAGKGGLTPERRRQIAADADAAEQAEAELLVDFQEACRLVGELRAEMEQTAGPHWRTSVQPPAFQSSEREKKAGGVRSDLSTTHCAAGHELTPANVHFFEDGTRRCRACRLESNRAQQAKKTRTGDALKTVGADALEAARALLSDPAHDDVDFKQAAKQLGMAPDTLRRRMPDVVAARQARRDQRPCYVRNPKLGKARAILLDPQQDALTLRQVAEAAGVSESTLFKQLPDDVSARTARQRDHSEAADKVRAMLLDPDNTMSIADIAASVGWSPTAPFTRVPDALEARRAMRARQADRARR